MTSITSGDWRQPDVDFLLEDVLPADHKEAFNVKWMAKKYFVEGESLYRKGFNGEPLRCVGREEIEKLLQEVHSGECGEH